MLTCKEFLSELTDFLDEATDREIRTKLEHHIAECPNCYVICDTTKKTISVFKGMKACAIPEEVHTRLMAALGRKLASGKEAADKNQKEQAANKI